MEFTLFVALGGLLEHSLLTHIGSRHILGKNCEKVPFIRIVKKMKKSFFFKIQSYKFVLNYHKNVWKEFQKLSPHVQMQRLKCMKLEE